MDKKLVGFLREWTEVDEAMEKFQTRDVIPIAFQTLINMGVFEKDELRKELSIYLKRIITTEEFENLLCGERQWIKVR